jgi:hypothetical protein
MIHPHAEPHPCHTFIANMLDGIHLYPNNEQSSYLGIMNLSGKWFDDNCRIITYYLSKVCLILIYLTTTFVTLEHLVLLVRELNDDK